jgi:large subunit ribosomal protein L25
MVKSGDASIELVKDSLSIEALPKDLPKEIVVDVSKIIDPNTVIFVKDLDLPAGVEIEDDLDLPVVTVVDLKKSAAAEEAKEAAAEEAELSKESEISEEESKDTEEGESLKK